MVGAPVFESGAWPSAPPLTYFLRPNTSKTAPSTMAPALSTSGILTVLVSCTLSSRVPSLSAVVSLGN